MPSYEERSRLIKALSEQQYFDAQTKPNTSIQIGAKRGDTGRYEVIHSDGGVTGNGDKIFNASAPQDGFVRGNSSGNAIALESRNISQVQAVPQQEDEAQTSNIIVLFLKDNKLYVGGDRAEPEQIYELNVGASFLGTPKVNKTDDGYIATFVVIDGLQQLLCTVIDGELIEQEFSTYSFRDLDLVDGTYSEGINCTLLSASFGVYRITSGVGGGGSFGVVLGQTTVTNGILDEINVVGATGAGGSYVLDGKSVVIDAPTTSSTPFFSDGNAISATFAFGGDYGSTEIDNGTFLQFEAICGSISYIGSGVVNTVAGIKQMTALAIGTSFGRPFSGLAVKNKAFAIRLRKQHPNSVTQNGFAAGAFSSRLSTYADLTPLPSIFPTASVYSVAVDVLNSGTPSISEGAEIMGFIFFSSTVSTFKVSTTLSLYFNSEDLIPLEAWFNYIGFNSDTVDRNEYQLGFRSYLVTTSLDRLSSIYATYNQNTTDDSIVLKRFGGTDNTINFGDLYLPLTDPIFPDEDPKNGVHLFNFYSPNLIQNKIYTVTTFPEEESGDVDIAIAEIQDNAVSFSTQTVAYVGLTDEFKDFIVDASFLG
jgi:hypothetical protein